MSMCAAGLSRKARDDHVRSKRANHADDIGQDVVLAPDIQRLPVILRKSKINCAREKLPPTVEPARGEQFLRAGHAELGIEVRAEDILPAVAARDGKIRGAV